MQLLHPLSFKTITMQFLCFFLLCSVFSSCVPEDPAKTAPVATVSEIIKNIKTFSYYKSDYLRLSEDFTAFNADYQKITKKQFFQLISTGNYLPLRLKKRDSILYRLSPLSTLENNSDIRSYLRQIGQTELTHYQMEGKPLPPYQFTDLNGQSYTPQYTKGKIMVINCWFIRCQACNQEMPELNQLVKKYKNRKDILFISLAYDSRQELKEFLTKKQFDYATIPVNIDYIQKQMKINGYPTHLIINKQGLIAKVMNDPRELTVLLAQEAAKL